MCANKPNDNLQYYRAKAAPPANVLKRIPAGRLKGMTDIRPQWRLQALTEMFGPVGFGWYLDIVRQWIEPGGEGEAVAFCNVNLFVNIPDRGWSKPIFGTGGSSFLSKEQEKRWNSQTRSMEQTGHHTIYTSDEAFKMALTDAISVACKSLGIASDIYLGHPGNYETQFSNAENNEHSRANVDDFLSMIAASESLSDIDNISIEMKKSNFAEVDRKKISEAGAIKRGEIWSRWIEKEISKAASIGELDRLTTEIQSTKKILNEYKVCCYEKINKAMERIKNHEKDRAK